MKLYLLKPNKYEKRIIHLKENYRSRQPLSYIKGQTLNKNLEENGFYSLDAPIYYAENKYILKWWNSNLDIKISTLIEQYQWGWYAEITNDIKKIISSDILNEYKNTDPLCKQYAWYNIIMNFAISRAKQLKLTSKIRKPLVKNCKLCNQVFIESSLPFPMVKKLGINNLDYCKDCLINIIYQNTGYENLSKEDIIKYIQDLVSIIKIIPSQNYGEKGELVNLNSNELYQVLKLMKEKKPTINRIKSLFEDSWLKALIEAGVLENNTRRTSRGTQTVAKDGHICFSLGEKTIDDFLYDNNIEHEREPHYPKGNYRGDFLVNHIFIEYFGLKGNPEYDKKIKLKQKLCKKYNIKLISIYPTDLVSIAKLQNKLKAIIKI